jgi:hypothetical protein
MQAIERQLRRMGWWTYDELARAVYGTDPPTRAQVSAVARAVARLESVEVWYDESDRRRRLVSERPAAVEIVLQLVDRAPYGLSYGQLAQSFYRTTTPSGRQRRSVVVACDMLVGDGRAWLFRTEGTRVMSTRVARPPAQMI